MAESDKDVTPKKYSWLAGLQRGSIGIFCLSIASLSAYGAETKVETQPETEVKTDDVSGRAPASHVEQDDDSDGEYDFSWLDPDKKVYVLQNRKFRKAKHFALYGSGALNLNNAFRNGYGGTARAAYNFTEQFGIEGLFGGYRYYDNSTIVAIRKMSSTLPFVREVRTYFGALGTWSPFYGKFNFFNHIIYYDWFINAGIGLVNTANDTNTSSKGSSTYTMESFTGLFFGTGQNFYLTKHFSVRLDLIGTNYGATGADGTSKRFTNLDFTAGVGYLF